MRIEFEKGMHMLALKKKMYIALLIDKNGVADRRPEKMLKKGVTIARRDGCEWVRKIYIRIIESIVGEVQFDVVMGILVDAITNLLEGKVNYEDLILIRSLGASYKNQRYFVRVYADLLERMGKPPAAGDRLSYIIIDNGGKTLGDKMFPPDEWLASQSNPDQKMRIRIDYMYYIEKLLLNVAERVLTVGYGEVMKKIGDNVKFRKTNRHKIVNITTPIKYLYQIASCGMSIKEIPGYIGMVMESLKKYEDTLQRIREDMTKQMKPVEVVIDG